MKITFVLPSLGKVGGTRAIFEIANHLKEKGHDVNIVFPLFFLKYNEKFKATFFLRWILSGVKNLTKEVNSEWFDLKVKAIRVFTLSSSFINFLKKQIPDSDIIIATSWETVYSVNKLPKEKGKKVYFIQHYEAWDLWSSEDCWREAEKLAREKGRINLAMIDVVPGDPALAKFKKLVDNTYKLPFKKITTSLWLKELLEEKLQEKVEGTVGIGNDFNTFGIKDFKEKESESKGRILMIYRRAKWKGDLDGIEALKIIKEKFPEIQVSFFDSKRDSNIPGWIDFHSNPSPEGLKKLYCWADIFILPSWVEGWGSPPMEAMACGAACVTTKVGGVPEYTIPDETAIVVSSKDPEVLAKAILGLLEDEEKRQRIAQAGYYYIQQFTWDKVADKFEKVLKKIIIEK